MDQVASKMETGDTLVVELVAEKGQGQVLVGPGRPSPSYILPEKEYFLYIEQKTWYLAEETCANEGGHLASISSEYE